MAVSMMYGILQIIYFKRYTMCGSWVHRYRFTKYMFFLKGVKGLRDFFHLLVVEKGLNLVHMIMSVP